jgi:cell division protease FtsH
VENAQVGDDDIPDVRFSDVAGVDEAVETLQDMLVFLTEPERFTRLGATLPRGIIFHGPPGTGKTLLARALAGEAGVPFFSVSGSEFVEMLVGRGAARMRSLFADARKHDAAVVFFDEFDALGKHRGSGLNGNDEREQTLNQLLVEMDGFEKTSRIVCIAATNRLDTLDPAVLRPGRFGEQILVDLPSEHGRRQILAVHARSKPFAADADLDRLAHITYGSSGADLADMLNRAAIKAGKADRDEITQADLEDGYLDAIAGPVKRNAALAGTEREVVAAHEAGHVLAAELCPTVEKAMRVSIQPRGRAGGMAVYGRTDRMLQDTQYLHEKLVGILGGRAAEFVTRGVVTSGAANDLQQANAMARQAVEELGFSARAGQLVSTSSGQHVRVSEETIALVDAEVRRLVEDAYQDAIRLLTAHREDLDRLASALLTAEDLDRPEIVAVLSGLADTPRAAPRRAHAGPQAQPVAHLPVSAHAGTPSPSQARRRGERLRVRLAALLLREPAGQRAYSAAQGPGE